MSIPSLGTPWLWGGFVLFILIMLIIDLGIFNRKVHAITIKEATTWSIVWISLALLFNSGIYTTFGYQPALEFFTGYLIEKALSVDNIFVFLVIFSAFAVPRRLQHRVLFWGIIGALLMRAFFIGTGALLLQKFEWIMYLFGAILVLTAIKLVVQREKEPHPERNLTVRLFRKFIPMTTSYDSNRFFCKENGKRVATPLMLVLVTIEITDLIFAVDSIPAIFAVTRDPFIVFTSNIFAILGLRSLFFLLTGIMEKFHYLKIGLSAILAYVGVKMLIMEFYHIPIFISLLVIAFILISAVIASLVRDNAIRKRAAL